MPHHIIQPGDGTRYDFVTTPDPYGGILIVWCDGKSVYRYYGGYKPEINFLFGNDNSFTRKALLEFMTEDIQC